MRSPHPSSHGPSNFGKDFGKEIMVATQPQQNPTSDVPRLMRDRVVLITGTSRGIGAATAKLLAQHGAAVGVNYYGSLPKWCP